MSRHNCLAREIVDKNTKPKGGSPRLFVMQ